jgi:DNA polymerase II small subunit/DNA polymerase delta subunit B
MQSFFGKINFVIKFVSNFIDIVKPLQKIIKKYVEFKWTQTKKDAFEKIKDVIVGSLTLRNNNFNHDFLLYTFAVDHSIIVILTQKYI